MKSFRLLAFSGLALVAGLVSSSGPLDLRDARVLNTRRIIRQRIVRGDTHIYDLSLHSGEYVRLTLAQYEIDVNLTVCLPDSRQLFAWNSTWWGSESVSLIASQPGTYRLLVGAEDSGTARGRYELWLVECRRARPEDNLHLQAQSAFIAARAAAAEETADSLTRAIVLFHHSARLYGAAGNTESEERALLNAGSMLARAGRFEESQASYREAVQRTERLNNELLRHEALEALRAVSYLMGEKTDELPHHLRALGLWRATGNRLGEAMILRRIGMSHRTSGDPVRAEAVLHQALDLQSALGNPSGIAQTLEEIGKVYLHVRRFDDAASTFSHALELRRANSDRRGQASTLYNLGLSLSGLGRFDEALASLENARKIQQGIGDVNSVAAVTTAILGIYFQLNQPEQVLREARQGAALVTSLRNSIKEPKWQAGLLDLHYPLEESIIEALMLLYDKHSKSIFSFEALLAADRIRTRSMGAVARELDLAMLERLRRDVLDADTVLLEFWLSENANFVWSATQEDILVARLPGRDQVETLAKQVYRLLAARNERRSEEGPHERQARVATAETEYRRRAAELGQMLLGPVAKRLRKKVLIVSNGLLQYIPFSALPDPGHSDGTLMIANHEVTQVTSAAALVDHWRAPTESREQQLVAVLADPVFDGKDPRLGRSAAPTGVPANILHATRSAGLQSSDESIPRLPFSRLEATEIIRAAGRGRSLAFFDFDVTREAVLDGRLNDYDIWHLAGHGLLNEDPNLSGLLLSLVDRNGRPVDGFLRVRDVLEIQIPADLVVLSACQTALGRNFRSDGVFGLTAAFLRAGAARVLSTAWKVDDEATADFMGHFYQGLLGPQRLPPRAALRAAQLAMERTPRWSPPYYWAGFLLYEQRR